MKNPNTGGPGLSPEQMQTRIAELEAEIARLYGDESAPAASSQGAPASFPVGTWYMDVSTGVPIWDDVLC